MGEKIYIDDNFFGQICQPYFESLLDVFSTTQIIPQIHDALSSFNSNRSLKKEKPDMEGFVNILKWILFIFSHYFLD